MTTALSRTAWLGSATGSSRPATSASPLVTWANEAVVRLRCRSIMTLRAIANSQTRRLARLGS